MAEMHEDWQERQLAALLAAGLRDRFAPHFDTRAMAAVRAAQAQGGLADMAERMAQACRRVAVPAAVLSLMIAAYNVGAGSAPFETVGTFVEAAFSIPPATPDTAFSL
ncbi:MAG: hypothetical protein EP335_08495 [Alphaproteobacteria bacterium]|nr:MAG: hypothetical protein EP335_08495 [Alphaproteobacteria bacterium]